MRPTSPPHHQILRSVVAAAEERRDGLLPMDVPGVAEAVGAEPDLLEALQQHWRARLSTEVSHALGRRTEDPVAAVERAWGATADLMPGVRMVLDRHQEQPLDEAMARLVVAMTATEHASLAVAAGLTGPAGEAEPAAPALGAALEASARRRRARTLTDLAGRAARDGAAPALAAHRRGRARCTLTRVLAPRSAP